MFEFSQRTIFYEFSFEISQFVLVFSCFNMLNVLVYLTKPINLL